MSRPAALHPPVTVGADDATMVAALLQTFLVSVILLAVEALVRLMLQRVRLPFLTA